MKPQCVGNRRKPYEGKTYCLHIVTCPQVTVSVICGYCIIDTWEDIPYLVRETQDVKTVYLCIRVRGLIYGFLHGYRNKQFYFMQKGWIKLHRKLLDNPLFKFPNYTLVWMYLLLNASHEGYDAFFNGKKITLKPGQLTCGANQIAKQMGVTRSSVERALCRFKVEEMVEVQTSNKCSLITVKKWSLYQDTEEAVEEQVRNKRGASEERPRTKQECNNEKNEIMKEPEPIPATPEVVAEKNEVNEILSVFQMKLNPTINYGNKTQRNAVSNMLKLMGKEKLLKMIEYAAAVSSEQFAPTITTPYQLKEKMAQLIAYYQKQNNKAPNIISV